MKKFIRYKLKKWLFPEENSLKERAGRFESQLSKINSDIDRRVLNLFCEKNHIVNPHHIFDITPNSGIPYLGQEPITKEKAKQLKSEADLLNGSLLWDVIQTTIKNEAIHIGLKTATDWNGTLQGKSMYINLEIIRIIVNKLLSIDPDKLPDASGKTRDFVL